MNRGEIFKNCDNINKQIRELQIKLSKQIQEEKVLGNGVTSNSVCEIKLIRLNRTNKLDKLDKLDEENKVIVTVELQDEENSIPCEIDLYQEENMNKKFTM